MLCNIEGQFEGIFGGVKAGDIVEIPDQSVQRYRNLR